MKVRASVVAAIFVAVSDLALAAIAYARAAAEGGLFARQAPVGAGGLALAALAAVLTSAGMPRLGILLTIGGVGLAGGFLRWDVVPYSCGPAILGAIAVLALFLRELARGTKTATGARIPASSSDPPIGAGIGLACAAVALAAIWISGG